MKIKGIVIGFNGIKTFFSHFEKKFLFMIPIHSEFGESFWRTKIGGDIVLCRGNKQNVNVSSSFIEDVQSAILAS